MMNSLTMQKLDSFWFLLQPFSVVERLYGIRRYTKMEQEGGTDVGEEELALNEEPSTSTDYYKI